MPAKKRCQAHLIVSSPPLPATTSHSSNPNPLPANLNPSSPTALAANKPLPATDASRDTLSCNKPAQRIVGDCGFCQGSFCADHRLPEQHGCSKLQACRDAAHAANKAKLESERTVARKISMA